MEQVRNARWNGCRLPWRWSRGQSMVEFALVLPVLLLIIFLIIEGALILQGYLAVQHAAREAARWAITYQPPQGCQLEGTASREHCDPFDPCTGSDATAAWWANWWNNITPRPTRYTELSNRCSAAETLENYNGRRVAMIKLVALERAVGLRINPNAIGLTTANFNAYSGTPGFFGVQVWGFPAFDAQEQLDHPSLPGLPIRIRVVHNVELMDPIFRAFAPYVRVESHVTMLNEGTQVGFGNIPPPTFRPPPTFIVPTQAPVTPTPTTPTPTPRPIRYRVDIQFDTATNQLPTGRGHPVSVRVTDQDTGEVLPNVRVSYSTSFGSFDYSGTGPGYGEAQTDSTGTAVLTVYANRPGTANLRAWIDINGNQQWDTTEPTDTATKQWTVSGPYIVASTHSVLPLDWISVSLYDHPPSGNPHRLLWCRTSVTGGISSAVLMTGINVDTSTWDALDLPVQIPMGSAGYYRLESHTGSGTCGNTATRVAYSADLYVRPVRPDMMVAALNFPSRIPVRNIFTVTAVISNTTAGLTTEIFDVDFYVTALSQPPPAPGQLGLVKQWVAGIGPRESTVITAQLWLPAEGQYRISARVDTTNYVAEDNEENNLTSVIVTAGCFYPQTITTGWFNPSTDNGNFSSATNAYTDGGGAASVSVSSNTTQTHQFYNYSLSVPTTATIQGIEVRLDWWVNSTAGSGSMGAELSWNNGSSWTSRKQDGTLSTSERTAVLGGPNDTWGRTWTVSELANNAFRVRVSAHNGASSSKTFNLDWVPVRVTYVITDAICRPPEPPPWDEGEIKPPGLQECSELLQVGGFEGNPQRIFTYWSAGGLGAYQHTGYLQRSGAFSMRLHASLGSYPTCAPYSPYLFQTVQVPTNVYTLTHLVVSGWHAVAGSLTDCSYRGIPDADDVLYVQLRQSNGSPITAPVAIVNGGVVTETWQRFDVNFTNRGVNVSALAGQNIQVYFYGTHDNDYYGTFFFLDDLSCSVCTYWPIPDPVPGTASIGGLVRALVGGVPQPLTGVNVWAYRQGSQVLRTRTIHDGTYHFYNIPPGTYTVYAATWVSGQLQWGTATVTVVADERNYGVDLLLQP
ncbi:MAG: TadE/TadG family type IV pilus assembly protein [Anaerolineae bacterium]|nr:TadE/TadG family type IV pilus assembly protein [Anaerolineae bacterium]